MIQKFEKDGESKKAHPPTSSLYLMLGVEHSDCGTAVVPVAPWKCGATQREAISTLVVWMKRKVEESNILIMIWKSPQLAALIQPSGLSTRGESHAKGMGAFPATSGEAAPAMSDTPLRNAVWAKDQAEVERILALSTADLDKKCA
eukprot:gene17447-27206_t